MASDPPKGVVIDVPTDTLNVTAHAPTVEVGSAYASTALAFRAPARQAAVLALAPKFQAIPDAVLHTIVAGAEPAAPHVGNPDFPEEMLRELSRFEQDQREAERLRQDARQSRKWSLVEKIALLIIGGVVTLVVKALFF